MIKSTSVCGLKYVPGRLVSSSSSNLRWAGAMSRLYPTARTPACSGVELGEGSLYLGLDVQRLQTLPFAPFVACDEELQHLLRNPPILCARRRRGRQPGELRLDVQRRLAPAHEPVPRRAQPPPDLLLALGPLGLGSDPERGLLDLHALTERRHSPRRRASQPTLADLVVRSAFAH